MHVPRSRGPSLNREWPSSISRPVVFTYVQQAGFVVRGNAALVKSCTDVQRILSQPSLEEISVPYLPPCSHRQYQRYKTIPFPKKVSQGEITVQLPLGSIFVLYGYRSLGSHTRRHFEHVSLKWRRIRWINLCLVATILFY